MLGEGEGADEQRRLLQKLVYKVAGRRLEQSRFDFLATHRKRKCSMDYNTR